MPGPFLPVWALSRSQQIRIGNHNSASGNHTVPMLTKNPSSAGLPTPYLVDLSDGTSRRDLAHHLALGSIIPAHALRLTSGGPAVNQVVSTTTETIVSSLTLPANALNVGAQVRFTAQGVIAATTPTLLAKIHLGPLGTTADPVVCATTAVTVTTAAGFDVNGLFTVQAIGSGATGKVVGNLQLTSHALSPGLSAQTAQVSTDTTVPEIATLSLTAGTSGITLTVTNTLAEFLDSAF